MVELIDLLHQKKDAIIQRWLDETLGTYAKETTKFFKRQKDQFANPVGNSLRVGSRAIVEGLLSEGLFSNEGDADADFESLQAPLEEIIKIRAIQDFTPSRAIEFILRLKQAIRTEIGSAVSDPRVAPKLAALEETIDRIALLAFDIYVERRELVFELRINELKRGVTALWRQWDDPEEGDDPEPPNGGPSRQGGAR